MKITYEALEKSDWYLFDASKMFGHTNYGITTGAMHSARWVLNIGCMWEQITEN